MGPGFVREIRPAKSFVLNEKAYPVTVSEDGDVVSIQLKNRYIRGNIEGTKLDEDGNVIAGAVFGLFREGETEFTEETAVRVTESDSTGKFRFEDIRYGKWIIRELKPATGYVLNETPIEVEITEDGKTVSLPSRTNSFAATSKATRSTKTESRLWVRCLVSLRRMIRNSQRKTPC